MVATKYRGQTNTDEKYNVDDYEPVNEFGRKATLNGLSASVEDTLLISGRDFNNRTVESDG